MEGGRLYLEVIPSIVTLMDFFNMLTAAVFPRFCVECGQEGGVLCATCAGRWQRACVADHFASDDARIIALRPYADKTAHALLRAWKYGYDVSAREALLQATTPLLQKVCRTLKQTDVDFEAIVPLPLSPFRLRERGFNQAEDLARWVSGVLNVPVMPLLRRRFRFGHQADRSHGERHKAMARTPFVLAANISSPCGVLLVDDVCTTGSTMRAAAEVLRAGGVEEVRGFCVLKG